MRAWMTKIRKFIFHPSNKIKIRDVGRAEKLSISDKFNKMVESFFLDFYEENRDHILYLKKYEKNKEIQDFAIEVVSAYVWFVKFKYDMANRITELYVEIDDMMGDGYEEALKMDDKDLQAKYGKRTLVTVRGMLKQIERLNKRRTERYLYRIKWILNNRDRFYMLEKNKGK